MCVMPPLSAETRACLCKLESCEESWSSLWCSSPSVSAPTQFTKMVLKVLFVCCWISSFPGREGTLHERWESWLNSHWGCLATDEFCCCVVFSPPSAIQYGQMSWSCRGSKSLPLSLTNLTLLAKDALVWCCGSRWPGLDLLGEPVATLALLRHRNW